MQLAKLLKLRGSVHIVQEEGGGGLQQKCYHQLDRLVAGLVVRFTM